MAQQSLDPGKVISFTRPPVEFGKSGNPLKRITVCCIVSIFGSGACNNSANGVIQIACALHKSMEGSLGSFLDTFIFYHARLNYEGNQNHLMFIWLVMRFPVRYAR